MKKAKAATSLAVPPVHDWRTTDEQEIERRRLRARSELFRITNRQPRFPIFSNFHVESKSGLTYSIEIRDLRSRQFDCDCVDFRINGLGTCKHVEAVLLHLEARFRRLFQQARRSESDRIDVVLDPTADAPRLAGSPSRLPNEIRKRFRPDGRLAAESVDAGLDDLRALAERDHPELRLSQEITAWQDQRQRMLDRRQARRDYELAVQRGDWPGQETKVPLFPYQREGMLHLAFTERALLADEMGLGKTIQAIAACSLLHRLGKAQHVLVVTPASLKTEWEEQIQRFTDLPLQLVFGHRTRRLALFANAPFFTITNYEQVVADALDINRLLHPDVVVLDEAQRIKNWGTKTAQAVKRLKSRYAFVLTGTPIENRIDELHSLMDFLDPTILGPLFRFNRDFYTFDPRGRPEGYRNLDQLHARIKPCLLRRRKADVETELPERTDRNHFVKLTPGQRDAYAAHEQTVSRLVQTALRRPLTQQQQDKLMRELAMMRMICDSNYILDPDDRDCPKLAELGKLLEECRENDSKVIVFSEWERMLELVREFCRKQKLGFAWHTGSVPQQRRRAEINAFKSDPQCRVFLSTDSGSTGLNLQVASVVINCDLPWNPARLEQRIARAWRKHQTRTVTVVNLVAEDTLEHRMLDTLAHKQALADGVLDLQGDLKDIKLRGGRQAFLDKLQQLVVPTAPVTAPAPPRKVLPADRPLGFAQAVQARFKGAVLHCEERYPQEGAHSVLYVVMESNPAECRPQLDALHDEYFGADGADPLAPVRLEVVDRATDEALRRLAEAGLIQFTSRGARPLLPSAAAEACPKLSDADQAKLARYREQANRRLKMARLLDEGGLGEEARGPLLEAAHLLACGFAVEKAWSEPRELPDALRPPLSHAWKTALATVRAFLEDSAAPARPLIEALTRL